MADIELIVAFCAVLIVILVGWALKPPFLAADEKTQMKIRDAYNKGHRDGFVSGQCAEQQRIEKRLFCCAEQQTKFMIESPMFLRRAFWIVPQSHPDDSPPVTAIHAVQILNDINWLDPAVTDYLINKGVPCSNDLASHETIQVGPDNQIGLLGIINGIFGVRADKCGHIVAIVDEETGAIKKFDLNQSPLQKENEQQHGA